MTVKNGQLPKGWREVRLNNVASIKTGPFGTQLHQRDYVQSNGTPIVTVEHLSERGLIHKSLPLVSHHDKQRLSQYLIQEGDIVFSRVGSVDRSALVSKGEDGWLFSGRLLRVRPKKCDVYSSYLNYFFHTQKFRHHMKSIAVGGTMPSINTSILSNVIIHLPSMDQQKAIASLLEKWDTVIEKTEALIEAKEKRFKWLLKTLISDQQDNPEWRQVKLVDACEVIVSPVDKKTVDGELPVKLCNYTDVYYNNAIDSKINFMAATAKPREIEKFSIVTDDVIITKDSETPDDIGVPAYVKETIDNLLCGYHLTILRPKKQTIGKYMCYALTSPRIKYDFYRFANGITRFGLTKESYQKIKIPLPPLPKQKRIANILDTAKEEVEFLEQLAKQYRTQKRGLMQKLLTGKWRVKPNTKAEV